MINIYDSKETNFTHNGLGVLSPSSAIIYEVLNGEYSLTLIHPIDRHNKWSLLEEDRIIKANGQLFRIYKVKKSVENKEVEVYALHIFYDLSKNFIEDTNIVSKSGAQALRQILSSLSFDTNFTCNSNITTVESARLVRKNVTQSLIGDDENSFLNRWGGEIKRDNFHFDFNVQIGESKGTKISYGKNLIGLTATIDMSNITTRIVPVAFDGITLPEKYVDSEYIDNYSNPIIRVVEFEDIKYAESPNNSSGEGYKTLDAVYVELRRRSNLMFTNDHIDIPSSNFEVDFVELSKTEQYKNYKDLETVNLGDVVKVEHKPLNIDFTVRVISYKYNCLLNRYDSIELGEQSSTIFTSINEIKKNESISLGTIIELVNVSKSETINKATELIQNGLGGYVIKTNDELIIADNPDLSLAVNVWRWNVNGLGFSSTGYNGTYGLALTGDGQIVADKITSGELNGEIIKANSIETNKLCVEAVQKIENAQSEQEVKTLINAGIGDFEVTINKKIEDNYYTKTETETQITQNAETIATKVAKEEFGKVLIGTINYILNSNVIVNLLSKDTNDNTNYVWNLSQNTPYINSMCKSETFFTLSIWCDVGTNPFTNVVIGERTFEVSSFTVKQVEQNLYRYIYTFTVEKDTMLAEERILTINCGGLLGCNSNLKYIQLEEGSNPSSYRECVDDVIDDYNNRIDTEIENIINGDTDIQNIVMEMLSDDYISDSERANLNLIFKEITSAYNNLLSQIESYESTDYFSTFVNTLQTNYQNVSENMDLILGGKTNGKVDFLNLLAEYYDSYHQLLYVVSQFLKSQHEQMSTEISQMHDRIDMVVTSVDTINNEHKKYMRFSNEGLELFTTINGELGKFKMRLSENRLSFFEDGVEVAYMSSQKLYISNAELTDSLKIGDVIGRKSPNGGFVFQSDN